MMGKTLKLNFNFNLVFRRESLKEVVTYIKSLPSFQAPRQKIGAAVLDDCVIKYMEKLLNTHWVRRLIFAFESN